MCGALATRKTRSSRSEGSVVHGSGGKASGVKVHSDKPASFQVESVCVCVCVKIVAWMSADVEGKRERERERERASQPAPGVGVQLYSNEMAGETGISDIGLVGLAVMGQNLALNIADKGFSILVHNRTASKVRVAR